MVTNRMRPNHQLKTAQKKAMATIISMMVGRMLKMR